MTLNTFTIVQPSPLSISKTLPYCESQTHTTNLIYPSNNCPFPLVKPPEATAVLVCANPTALSASSKWNHRCPQGSSMLQVSASIESYMPHLTLGNLLSKPP